MKFLIMCILKHIGEKPTKQKVRRKAKQKGVSLIEIIITVGIFIVFILPTSELLYSMNHTVKTSDNYFWHSKFLLADDSLKSYKNIDNIVGKKSCEFFIENNDMQNIQVHNFNSVKNELVKFVGTSSLPTSIQVVESNLLLTMNSSSTTEPDFFIFNKVLSGNDTFSLISSLDTGPGIASMYTAGFVAYVADMSVNHQVTAISIFKPEQPVVLKTFTFPSSSSATSPIAKRVAVYGQYIIIGTEKSTLPEIEIFDIKSNKLTATINTEFGINSLYINNNQLIVLGPSNPELNVYDLSVLYEKSTSDDSLIPISSTQINLPITLTTIFSYDAPGGSGNGRSIDVYAENAIFGRSEGGEELSVLNGFSNKNISSLHDIKINASVDTVVAEGSYVFVFTADPNKELMIFSTKLDDKGNIASLVKVRDINLPARVADFVCDNSFLYIALQSNTVPVVGVW